MKGNEMVLPSKSRLKSWHTFYLVLSVIAALLSTRAMMIIVKVIETRRRPHMTPVTIEPGLTRISHYKGPVIGILGQDIKRAQTVSESLQPSIGKTLSGKFAKYGNNYIPASYVRFVETAGARVVPIPTHLPKDQLREIFNSINGVYFTGGAQRFPDSQFYETAKQLYEWAVEENEKGDPFPMWGTCLGFQLLNNLAANATRDIRKICRAHDLARPVTLTKEGLTSRALKDLDPKVLDNVQKDPAAYYFHTKCITLDLFDDVLSDMRVISTNRDLDNIEYATFVEHKKYPFYATQFHPEKVVYEWNPRTSVERPLSGILLNQHLANFFKAEAMKSTHRFKNAVDFHTRNIENYPHVNTMLLEYTILTGYYFFDDKSYDKPAIDYYEIGRKLEQINTLINREVIKW